MPLARIPFRPNHSNVVEICRRKVALRADALSDPQDCQEATVALRGLIERASCSLPSRAVGSRCMGARVRGSTMCIFDTPGESASPCGLLISSAITVTRIR